MLFQTARSGFCTYICGTNSAWLEHESCDLNDHIQSDRISEKNYISYYLLYHESMISNLMCTYF